MVAWAQLPRMLLLINVFLLCAQPVLANFQFGSISDSNSTKTLLCFLLLFVIIIVFEFMTGLIDYLVKKRPLYVTMMEKIYKELTLMGVLALIIIMIGASGTQTNAKSWILTFEITHIVTFFTTMCFVIHAMFLMYVSYGSYKRNMYMSWLSEDILLEKINKMNILESIWFNWSPAFNPIREAIEYKCLELLFRDTFWLPLGFDVPMYLSGCFERYALKTAEIGVFNWSVLAALISLNYARVQLHLGFNCKKPESYSDQLIMSTSDSIINQDYGRNLVAASDSATGADLFMPSPNFGNADAAAGTEAPPYYYRSAVRRMLGGTDLGTVVDPKCYDRLTYFFALCCCGLMVFTLFLLTIARLYESRLIRRSGIRHVSDYPKLLQTMDSRRRTRELAEANGFDINEGRATIQELFNEVEECADEHEQEDEEEAVYKSFLQTWRGFSDYIYETTEFLIKNVLRWVRSWTSPSLVKEEEKAKSVVGAHILENQPSRKSFANGGGLPGKPKENSSRKKDGSELQRKLLNHETHASHAANSGSSHSEGLGGNDKTPPPSHTGEAHNTARGKSNSITEKLSRLSVTGQNPFETAPAPAGKKHDFTNRDRSDSAMSKEDDSSDDDHSSAGSQKEANTAITAAAATTPDRNRRAAAPRKASSQARRGSIMSHDGGHGPGEHKAEQHRGSTMAEDLKSRLNEFGRRASIAAAAPLSAEILARLQQQQQGGSTSAAIQARAPEVAASIKAAAASTLLRSDLAILRESLDANYQNTETEDTIQKHNSTWRLVTRKAFAFMGVYLMKQQQAVSQDPSGDVEAGGFNMSSPDAKKRLENADAKQQQQQQQSASATGSGSQTINQLHEEVETDNATLYTKDLDAIYLFNSPHLYNRAVETCIMMHCFYLGVWFTNFISIVRYSSLSVVIWECMIIIPLCFVSLPALSGINKTSNKLHAVSNINTHVMLETCKNTLQALEQSSQLRENILSRVSEENVELDTREQKITLVESLFGAVDMDGSGEIDEFEFRILLRQLDITSSDAKFRTLFSSIDMEASGVIKKYMFYNMLFPCNKIELKEINEHFTRNDSSSSDRSPNN